MEKDIKRILVLDAGGMRGIIALHMLVAIEEKLEKPLLDYFDLMAGTSTGALIIAGLAKGMTAKQILEKYLSNGPDIFAERLHSLNIKGIWGAKYKSDNLKAIIEDIARDTKMEDLEKNCAVIIPTVNTQGQIVVFKTPHDDSFFLDGKKLVSDVLMSSISAPFYFKAHESIYGDCYMDGAVIGSNPSDYALLEAQRYFKWDMSKVKVLNIGCGDETLQIPKDMGLLHVEKQLIPLAMKASVEKSINIAKFVMGDHADNFIRISPQMKPEKFRLDITTPSVLKEMEEMANSEIRKKLPGLKNNFF